MPIITALGKGRLCGKLFTKARIGKHLTRCPQRAQPAAAGGPSPRCFHLAIQAPRAADYWLHLEAPAEATFGAVDDVLRGIWLEGCDHLSAFEFPQPRLRVSRAELENMLKSALAALAPEPQGSAAAYLAGDDDGLMLEPLGDRLAPGVEFKYEYDFGSTTKLSLRVVAVGPSAFRKPGLHVLARNEPPEILCVRCGKPATKICRECGRFGDGAFCRLCAKTHGCWDEYLLPIINSPRVGVCGYQGPSKEP